MKRPTFKIPEKPIRSVKAELRRELGWVIAPAEKRTGEVLRNHPRKIFWVMVAIIVVSVILRFTVLSGSATPEKNQSVVAPAYQQLKHNSVEALPNNSLEKLQKMIELRTQMEAILRRGHLSHADSLFIVNAGDSIKKIQNESKQ